MLLEFCLYSQIFLPFLCLLNGFQMPSTGSFAGSLTLGIHFAEVRCKPECVEINIPWIALNDGCCM